MEVLSVEKSLVCRGGAVNATGYLIKGKVSMGRRINPPVTPKILQAALDGPF
jgi:hypothetical protein